MVQGCDIKVCDVQLDTINKVKDFVSATLSIASDISLVSHKYVVDAKSIMGIFSLDLSKPLGLYISEEGKSELDKIMACIKDYIVVE